MDTILQGSFCSSANRTVGGSLIKTLLLVIVLYVSLSSVEVRTFTANALRLTASWIDPNGSPKNNPRHFQVPNPFYMDKEEKRFLNKE